MLTKLVRAEKWQAFFENEAKKSYFQKLEQNYIKACENTRVFPPKNELFKAFELCTNTKIIILGQDPYHKKGLANGLCFSVKKGVKIPPSLRNIFKELNADLGVLAPTQGDLSPWARQGVLLLNASFSVEENKPNSHVKLGWSELSKNIIKKLSLEEKGLVFILWGRFAQGFCPLIDEDKHFIIKSAHPSPFSAAKFFGSKPFSRANAFLKKCSKSEINWELV